MKIKNMFLTIAIILLLLVSFSNTGYTQEAPTKIRWGINLGARTSEADDPPDNYGTLYIIDEGGMQLRFRDDDDNTTDITSIASGGDLDDAYDNGATITADGGAVTINNTDADNANNVTINKSPSSSATGSALGIVSGANCTSPSIDIANSGTGYDIDGTSSTWYISKTGTITCASLVATTNYMTAIAAAASGNSNLTIDASGTGTITLAGTSTGNIVNTTETDFLGNVDFGNANTDTISFTSVADTNLTFDDGDGAAPGIVLKDGSDETATLVKVDTGFTTLTTESDSGLQILTGGLKIGNGSPGTMNGEDFYCEGVSEFDGAMILDGSVTANGAVSCVSTLALSENVTFTMAADEYLKLDAATTAMTQTDGALDINVIAGATDVRGIYIDLEAENTFANLYGLYINIDDDGSGGDETVTGVYVTNPEGTASITQGIAFANNVDDDIVSTVAAAGQFAVIDAATADHTETDGVFDIAFDTITNGASCINIDMGTTTGGSDGDDYNAILIDLDDDTDATSDIIGVKVSSSDLTGDTNTKVIGFYSSGLDCALQADNGYVRIGTGSTEDQALGDDDMFVEGHIELDAGLYVDGTIVGDGATTMLGVIQDVSACAAGGDTLTVSDAGVLVTNTGAAGTITITLPEGSTCNGASFSFAVTAAQHLRIDPADAVDDILGLTTGNGKYITSNAAGDFITLTCVGDDSWVVSASNNCTNSADSWASE